MSLTARDTAEAWLDGRDPPPADASAVAWALKDLCYEAWATEPPRAAQAADALARLAATAPGSEVHALAQWAAAIAALTRGQMAQAIDHLDAAAAGLRAAGRADPAAQTQVPKIMALSMLGRHDDAVACAEATQAELQALGNRRAAARVALNLGNLHNRRDAYALACRHFRDAAALFAKEGDHAHSVLADIGLAGALTGLGDFEEARRMHARARMRAAREQLELHLAQLDESEALLDLATGRYREALAGLESARRRYEALAMPQTLAIAEKQLADAYLELHLLPEAQALFAAAVQRFAELDLPDEQAWALVQRGRAEALQQRRAADASFAAAELLFAQQGNVVGAATVAFARAELALLRGDAAAALAASTQAADGYAHAQQADGAARAGVLHAQALLQAGRVAEAEAAFTHALAGARERGQRQVEVRCLSGLGAAARARGDATAAAQALEAAIALFEEQRRALPGDEIRSAFLTDHLRPYEERLALALDTGEAPAQVLLHLERFRARAWDERLGAAAPAAEAGVPAGLRDRLNWLYRRVQRAQEEGPVSAALADELRRTEDSVLEEARRARLAAPAAADDDGAVPADPRALQAALAEGDVLVEYGVAGDELFAIVVRPDGVHLARCLAGWPEVAEALRALRFQLEALAHGSAPLARQIGVLTQRAQARLARAAALVWAPLAPWVGDARRVLVVPHGALAGLPFGALPDGDLPLAERRQLAQAPSARAALHGLRRPALAPQRVLALGESSRLPHAAAEAQAVAACFPEGQALVGDDATLAAFRRAAGDADVLHLACHAQFRGDNPRFSALHLADGALTVESAEALALRPGLVVLSACETARADADGGGEQVGLVRAFIVAGAARVVASGWPVDDAATAAFMAHFHRRCVAGDAPAVALAAAQHALRANLPHPCFWGAFTLHGGW